MMNRNKKDNEVYILGSESGNSDKKIFKKGLIISLCVLIAVIFAILLFVLNKIEQVPEYYFEPEKPAQQSASVVATDSIGKIEEFPYTEVFEENAGNLPLLVYVPRNASMSLMVGMPDKSDSNIVFAAMAADIRKDNMQIVGDFVLSGKQLARGTAKTGYAAISDNKVTIGVGKSTPLLQQAIDDNGYFFRQYPLVANGELIENKLKNNSIRRALAVRNGQIIIVESKNRLSFHDFSQALIDVGVSDAIYLVGGDTFGWYHDNDHVRHELGKELPDIPDNISYIIWR